MDIKKIILVKYGEIYLRKGNRALYERQLIDTLRRNLRTCGENGNTFRVLREQGRLLIEDVRGDIDERAVLPRIRTIFGITAFCVGIVSGCRGIDEIKELALTFFHTQKPRTARTFKVETKRGDKHYPLTSREISSEVGGYVLEHEPEISVDVHKPDVTLWIELRNRLYMYLDSVPGEGGLPYGSSGKGVLLLSGGIDSPVAGYLCARRGVEIMPVYFHSPPHTSERAAEKAVDLARRLAAYTGPLSMKVVPFTETQLFLYEHVAPEKLTLLLKRAMLRIASALAYKENAHCLITGDSVGQVASQTIHGLEAVNSAAALPVLRPLAAMDKQQIVDIAVGIGTYDISIRPYEDCCTLFVAEHPECRPKTSVIEAIEARLHELPAMYARAVENAETRVIEA